MRPSARTALLILFTAGSPAGLIAQGTAFLTATDDSSAWVMDHVALARGSAQLVTRDSTVVLALLDTVLVVELTDDGIRRMAREARTDVAREAPGARLIVDIVMGGLEPMLAHAIGYRLRELADARYDGGRLHLVDRHGQELFDHTEVRHRELMEDFDPAAARRFVAEIRSAQARLH